MIAAASFDAAKNVVAANKGTTTYGVAAAAEISALLNGTATVVSNVVSDVIVPVHSLYYNIEGNHKYTWNELAVYNPTILGAMAAEELDEFLRNGNIRNSVNYPSVSMPHTGIARICVCHRNVPAVLSGITTAISAEGINIENMTNGSRGEYAYTIVEVGSVVSEAGLEKISAIEGVLRVTEYN